MLNFVAKSTSNRPSYMADCVSVIVIASKSFLSLKVNSDEKKALLKPHNSFSRNLHAFIRKVTFKLEFSSL